MIELLWWNDRTFDQAFHTQARLYIFTLIAYMNDRMTHGELEILAYVRVEVHDLSILNGFISSCLIVETHGLGSTSVQGITGAQWTLLHCGHPCIVKLTFPLDLDQVSHSRYLLQARHNLFIAFR